MSARAFWMPAPIGDVFASPSAEQMADSMRAADGGAGVVRLYGNYGGDVMNFDMAGEIVEMEDDIESTTVLLADDVVSAEPDEASKRRGTGGMIYAFKIAGAMAERMADLEAVTGIAQPGRRQLPVNRNGTDALHRAPGRKADIRAWTGRNGDGHGDSR